MVRIDTAHKVRTLMASGRLPARRTPAPKPAPRCTPIAHAGPFDTAPDFDGWLDAQWVQCQGCGSHIVSAEA